MRGCTRVPLGLLLEVNLRVLLLFPWYSIYGGSLLLLNAGVHRCPISSYCTSLLSFNVLLRKMQSYILGCVLWDITKIYLHILRFVDLSFKIWVESHHSTPTPGCYPPLLSPDTLSSTSVLFQTSVISFYKRRLTISNRDNSRKQYNERSQKTYKLSRY